MGEKKCTKCGKTKPLSEFYKRSGRDSYRSECKACVAKWHKKYSECEKVKKRKREATKRWQKRHPEKHKRNQLRCTLRVCGWTLEEYEAAVKRQKGKCAICKKKCGTRERLSADHCHKTGKPRALLCTKCNAAIGFLHDDPKLVRRAAEYLESFEFDIMSKKGEASE